MARWRLVGPAAGLFACGLAVAAVGGPQQPAPVPPAGPFPEVVIPLLTPRPPDAAAAPKPAPLPPAPPTVDQLIDQLAAVRSQKAELEALERDLIKAIQDRLQHQKDRLAKLALDPPPPGPVAPARADVPVPPPGPRPVR